MALEPLIFNTGSKIFEISYVFATKQIGKFNCIQSERFKVGGYDWVIEFYPVGINELVRKDVTSIAVRVLNPTEEFQATFCLSLWNRTTSKWGFTVVSGLITLSSSEDKACCRWVRDNYLDLSDTNSTLNNVKDETIRIKCALCVTPRQPSPTSAVKPDVDKADDNGNQGNPSGANSSFDNGFHTADYAPPNGPNNTKLPRQPTVRIYCEANKDLSLTIRNGSVVLAQANSNDYYQHWIKDMSIGDEFTNFRPAFALVNRVTGEALTNAAVPNQEVSLVPYRLKNFLQWTEVRSTGFRHIRIAGITSLNLTAIGSDYCDDEGINFSDGTKVFVYYWLDKPSQKWKIVPYNSNVPY
ncbi:uncharacterized protein LOC144554522 [Carex rostrata]